MQTGRALVEAGLHPATDADQATLDKLLELTERYCVLHQTLARSPAPTMELAPVGASYADLHE